MRQLLSGNKNKVLVLVGVGHLDINDDIDNLLIILRKDYQDSVFIDIFEEAVSPHPCMIISRSEYLLYRAIIQSDLLSQRFMVNAHPLPSLEWVIYRPPE